MPSVDELRLKQKEIEDQIKDQLKEEKQAALSNIRKQMKKYKITFVDIEKSLAPGRGYKVEKISTVEEPA